MSIFRGYRYLTAQTRTSTGCSFPSSVTQPSGEILAIPPQMTVVFSSLSDSRYPTPGVMRRHPAAHFGINCSISTGFFKTPCIEALKLSRDRCWVGESARKRGKTLFILCSIPRRNLSSALGSLANSSFSFSSNFRGSNPATPETIHDGSRMKVVILDTCGRMAGRIWIPDELSQVIR